jgi:hypothetical protein
MTEIHEPRNREQWRAGIRKEWQRVKQRGTPIAEAMTRFDEVLLEAHPEWLLDDGRYQAAFGVYSEIRDIGREVYGDE